MKRDHAHYLTAVLLYSLDSEDKNAILFCCFCANDCRNVAFLTIPHIYRLFFISLYFHALMERQ